MDNPQPPGFALGYFTNGREQDRTAGWTSCRDCGRCGCARKMPWAAFESCCCEDTAHAQGANPDGGQLVIAVRWAARVKSLPVPVQFPPQDILSTRTLKDASDRVLADAGQRPRLWRRDRCLRSGAVAPARPVA